MTGTLVDEIEQALCDRDEATPDLIVEARWQALKYFGCPADELDDEECDPWDSTYVMLTHYELGIDDDEFKAKVNRILQFKFAGMDEQEMAEWRRQYREWQRLENKAGELIERFNASPRRPKVERP